MNLIAKLLTHLGRSRGSDKVMVLVLLFCVILLEYSMSKGVCVLPSLGETVAFIDTWFSDKGAVTPPSDKGTQP